MKAQALNWKSNLKKARELILRHILEANICGHRFHLIFHFISVIFIFKIKIYTLFFFLACAFNVLKYELSIAYVLAAKNHTSVSVPSFACSQEHPQHDCSREPESANTTLAEELMAREKSLLLSPNQTYAAISLLVIITAIPDYSGQPKNFLLLLYHISSDKAGKSCNHLNRARTVGCMDRLQPYQTNVCDSNPNTFYACFREAWSWSTACVALFNCLMQFMSEKSVFKNLQQRKSLFLKIINVLARLQYHLPLWRGWERNRACSSKRKLKWELSLKD